MNNSVIYGWVSQPNGRGTLDIVWSCLSTIFFCSWSVLCLNIPAPGESESRQIARKLKWMILAIIFPELVLYAAYMQSISARRSVERFRKLKSVAWTSRHGFYTDMGGITLKAPGTAPFPISASQLFYLLDHKHLEFPKDAITKIDREIHEKNQSNGFTRLITVTQVGWFVLQFVGRLSQGATITTLELATLAFVACTLPTFLCWRRKPAGIQSPGLQLLLEYPIDTVVQKANLGHTIQVLSQRPLTFADEDVITCVPVHRGIGKKFGMPMKPDTASIDRIKNDRQVKFTSQRFSWDYAIQQAFRVWVIAYGAVHLGAWNFYFPSNTERILWIVSGLCVTFAVVIFQVATAATVVNAPWFKYANASDGTPPPLPIPVVITFLAGTPIYVFARAFVIVESFAGLRALPASAYASVVWPNFPHF